VHTQTDLIRHEVTDMNKERFEKGIKKKKGDDDEDNNNDHNCSYSCLFYLFMHDFLRVEILWLEYLNVQKSTGYFPHK